MLPFFIACTKFEKKGEVNEPGIALTFDDYTIDNWHNYLPLLDSFGAKATFYISNYHQLSRKQKYKLHEIQQHGHEIAFHSTNHYNMPQYLSAMGVDSLLKYEVFEDLEKMKKDGFNPVTFAYPYGKHNDFLDYNLLKIFKSVRALNGSPNHARSCTSTTNNSYLYALGIDDGGYNTDMILKMMDLSKTNRNCLVLVAHQINNLQSKLSISYTRLKDILTRANQSGMRYYTVSEISNK